MDPSEIIATAVVKASSNEQTVISEDIRREITSVVRCKGNRAPARFLLACALAKAHRPDLNATEPYTEIGSPTCFSGRDYDQAYIDSLRRSLNLPLNPTTGFLTPGFRADKAINSADNFRGRPKSVYVSTAKVLESVQRGTIRAEDVLASALRELLKLRDEKASRLNEALSGLSTPNHTLSTEDVLTLLDQHIKSRNASRLPVILVAALYNTLTDIIGESALSLGAHNAADSQTGALGDIEVELSAAPGVPVTVYEIKARAVTLSDLHNAVEKLSKTRQQPDNYLFVTTYPIEREVVEYANELHARIGVEFAVLDAMSFARYLLHFFHRHRLKFLNAYQNLLLEEPESAVRLELKEAWFSLRKAAES